MTIRITAALTAGILTFLPGGTAAAEQDVRVSADLNGDGTNELVTVESAGTADQRIESEVDGREISVAAPADTRSQVERPRVTDLDGDGAAELVVLEYTGANTDSFGVWAYVDGALRSLGSDTGETLRLYEGGGVSARSGYSCEDVGGGRELAVLSAQVDGEADETTYSGSWTYYQLRDGIVTPSGTTTTFTFVGADNALLSPDADTCKA